MSLVKVTLLSNVAEPEPLTRDGAGAGMKFRLPTPAPGQTKLVNHASDLLRNFFQKIMKTLLFHLKAVSTGNYKL